MKKMETKKIGVVLGAALLASSAFGAVSFGNTELVNNNGQVVATVVVGEKASISDGVAAAKIASMLASRAYKTTTLKAEVLGKEGVTCSATGGNATCQVVDKSVDLTIIMPGLRSNQVVSIQPLIAERLDLELGDRDQSSDDKLDDLYKLWDDRAHPFTDQNGSVLGSAPNPYYAFVVDHRNYDGFKQTPVTGRMLSGIEEKQRVYLRGYSYYDSSDHVVKMRLESAVYQVVFGPNDYGLPLCPGDSNKQYGNCSKANQITSSRAAVQFMGDVWYITKVDIPVKTSATVADKQVYQIPNTEVHLAKESRYGIISVGEFLETEDGAYRIVLDDINKNDILGNPAIISIVDRNNNTLVQDQITPGETKKYTLGGKDVFVHVYQTAPGTVQLAKWAEVAIVKDTIVLKDGEKFLDDDNTEYDVSIGLTLKGSVTGADITATHLKSITVHADNLNEDLNPGSSYMITDVPGYKAYELKYEGLTDPGFVTLTVNARTSPLTLASLNNTLNKYMEVNLAPSSYDVRINANLPSSKVISTTRFYVVQSATLFPGNSTPVLHPGTIVVRDPSTNSYYATNANVSVSYRPLGSNGKIVATSNASGTIAYLGLEEEVGKVLNVDSIANLSIGYDDPNDDLVSFADNDDEVTYNSPTLPSGSYGYTSGSAHYETKFISLRGTEVTGSGKSRTFKIPLQVRRLELLFRSAKQQNVSANEYKLAGMREGETRDVPASEVKVRVDAIKCQTQVVGSMSGTAVPNLDSLRAEIFEGTVSRGASVNALVPAYTGSSYPDIVKLDREVTTGTMILVGGPKVNSKTAEVMQGAQVQLSPSNRVVVQEVATGKIVVAGWEAEDTLQAVSQFLNQLRVN